MEKATSYQSPEIVVNKIAVNKVRINLPPLLSGRGHPNYEGFLLSLPLLSGHPKFRKCSFVLFRKR